MCLSLSRLRPKHPSISCAGNLSAGKGLTIRVFLVAWHKDKDARHKAGHDEMKRCEKASLPWLRAFSRFGA